MARPNTPAGAAALSSDWLLFGEPDARPEARLFCFHHAGGGASLYRDWSLEAPDWLGVQAIQLPGRQFRIREPLLTDLSMIDRALVDVIEPLLDRPYAFFGHSMGATVAFSLISELRRRGLPLPVHLGVSGRIAPHVLSRSRPARELSDEELVERLKRFGGIPEQAFRDPTLMAAMLPLVRADYEIVDNYRYVPEPPLMCDITVFWARDDDTADENEVAAWARHTTGDFNRHAYDGGHFFVLTHAREIREILYRALLGSREVLDARAQPLRVPS